MTLLCCQFDIVWEDKPANHARVSALLEQAKPPAGSLILLPEMFATGFSMNVTSITDSTTAQTHRFLSSLATRHASYVLAGLVTTADDGRGRNQALLFSPQGAELARYQKIHPFTFGGESNHYQPGSRIVTFPWGPFTVCPFICYDLRFPEIFRLAARQGANLFTVIANWPASREHHWLTLLQARAIENQAYVAAVNRSGRDNVLSYPGRSLIIDPRGQILADAGNSPAVIQSPLDFESLQTYRTHFPALQDLHPEHFPPTP